MNDQPITTMPTFSITRRLSPSLRLVRVSARVRALPAADVRVARPAIDVLPGRLFRGTRTCRGKASLG